MTTVRQLVKDPSAFVPVLMSLTALAVLGVHVAVFGTAREADEGTAAHLWQLLMAAQLPIVAWFGVKWLPRAPRQAIFVLVAQGAAILAALAPVFILGL
jgi:cytochrome bd-type quinol oxidase subunit 2